MIDLTEIGFESQQFHVMFRREFSESRAKTISKDLADPLWEATYSIDYLPPEKFASVKARLQHLESRALVFRGYDMAGRQAVYGSVSGVTMTASAVDRVSFTAPAGFFVRAGDYFSVTSGNDTWLFQIAADSTSLNDVPITPDLPSTALSGKAARFNAPFCNMIVVPGTLKTRQRGYTGSISFSAQQWFK